jgi:hypothetical protein
VDNVRKKGRRHAAAPGCDSCRRAGHVRFAGTAFSDNCFNLSRTSAGLSTNPADFTSPYTKGRWVWLPSVGAPIPAWGFEVPANYQHGNVNAWLLSNTKYCEEGGFLFYNGPRTTEHGVQSGCGAFG